MFHFGNKSPSNNWMKFTPLMFTVPTNNSPYCDCVTDIGHISFRWDNEVVNRKFWNNFTYYEASCKISDLDMPITICFMIDISNFSYYQCPWSNPTIFL